MYFTRTKHLMAFNTHTHTHAHLFPSLHRSIQTFIHSLFENRFNWKTEAQTIVRVQLATDLMLVCQIQTGKKNRTNSIPKRQKRNSMLFIVVVVAIWLDFQSLLKFSGDHVKNTIKFSNHRVRKKLGTNSVWKTVKEHPLNWLAFGIFALVSVPAGFMSMYRCLSPQMTRWKRMLFATCVSI